MSTPKPQHTGILYSSPSSPLHLLDIPTSIRHAQGPQWHATLLSRPPLTEPLRSTEPKSEKARAKITSRGQGSVDPCDAERIRVIREALERLKGEYTGALVLPRAVIEVAVTDEEEAVAEEEDVDTLLPVNKTPASRDKQEEEHLHVLFKSLLHTSTHFITSQPASYSLNNNQPWHPWPSFLSNSTSAPQSLHIRANPNSKPMTFRLPPASSFLLMTLPPSTPSFAPTPPTGFDLILLDPPWPNRSVKRARAYTNSRSLETTVDLLNGLNLSAHLSESEETVLAIWVTNSASIREIASTWLDGLGFMVVEEWIWVKVTTVGEPILELDGIWRKPYEVLLVARPICREASVEDNKVKRRVIIAVPDVHSRKPSLKSLFESLLGLPKEYQALEVFARHLTAGWHSWGNETLLYNWEGHWIDETNMKNDF